MRGRGRDTHRLMVRNSTLALFHKLGIEGAASLATALSHHLDPTTADIATQAWDEGYASGHSNAMRRMSDEPNVVSTPNPYRDGGAS